MKRLLFLTGHPGVGKTSVLLRAVEVLKTRGYKTGGMISREIRQGDIRVGFEILDLQSGRKGWLAHVNQPSGPQVGKYRVNLNDINAIGVEAILNAKETANIIVVDEVGPMELFSQAFKDAIVSVVESGKLMLGTIHQRARDPLINMIKAREDAEIFEVTYENRGYLHETVIGKAVEFLQKPS